jgi:tetraacyldisaccharide 4'-kinase
MSVAFGLGVTVRSLLYEARVLPVERAARPVVSIGNLTVGGTGKTPFVRHLTRALLRHGLLAGILIRGHGVSPRVPKLAQAASWRDVGDEAALLARWLPGVPVLACRDRARAARRLLRALAAVDLFVLDDGFQHRRLARDLDIVLLDASNPWGGGRLLPAGLLRERPESLARSDIVVLTRAGMSRDIGALGAEVVRLAPSALIAVVEDVPQGIARADGSARRPLSWLAGLEVLAVAGIGRPAAFEHTLRGLGASVELLAFPDHHPYEDEDARRLLERARGRIIVTTEKDAVRWPEGWPGDPWVLESGLRFREGEESLIRRVLDAAASSRR